MLSAPALAATPLETDAATAPSYPGNTIAAAFSVDGPIVAATTQTVDLRGHAEFPDPGFPATHTPSVFLQDAGVDPSCAPTVAQQRQKLINDTLINASAGGSGWVLDETQFAIRPAPPATGADWTTRTQPFTIRAGVSQVLLCSYVRYVTDDVAVQATRWKVEQPLCAPVGRSVRRGRSLVLRCNFSGRVSARLTRGGTRITRTVTVRAKDQRARLSTRGARRGTNRLAFSLDGKTYGAPVRVRIR
jgi:hypothetical protein